MKYSKIIICNFRSKDVLYFPTYELFLAEAMKRKGLSRDIKIFTCLKDENHKKYYKEFTEADIIIFWEAFSTKAYSYIKSYFKLAKILKRTGIPLYFGGFWATSYGRYFEEFKIFDKIIEGYSINKLAEQLLDNKDKNDFYININGDSNYSEYPLKLEYLATPEKYFSHRPRTIWGYISSFSCPMNCKFCFANSVRNCGTKFEARNVDEVKQDIKVLDDYYNFEQIVIKDLNFFYNKKRAREILEYLKKNNKKIFVNLDITLKDINDDFIRQISEFNVVEDLYFGLESFNEIDRKKIGKFFKDEDLDRAFKIVEKNNIKLTGNIIIGFPWQTFDDIKEQIKKALYYMNNYKNIYIVFNAYKPEYGTDIQREYFSDIHKKINFIQLVDIYMNKVSKYQRAIYGPKFDNINIEKLFCAIYLILEIKRNRVRASRFNRMIMNIFKKILENQLQPPFFANKIFSYIILDRRRTFFIIKYIIPFSMKNVFRFFIDSFEKITGRDKIR